MDDEITSFEQMMVLVLFAAALTVLMTQQIQLPAPQYQAEGAALWLTTF